MIDESDERPDIEEYSVTYLRGRVAEQQQELDELKHSIDDLVGLVRDLTATHEKVARSVAVLKPNGEPHGLDAPIISAQGAAAFLGVSTSTIDRMTRDGRMPEPVRVSERRPCWTVRQLMEVRAKGLFKK
ncbi:hypothetical protein SAMN04488061_1881 [Filomicrobium insigne]|uniref:Helix-turn-helix domain-containing protein n=1 Tax=Filomicrobium insigne TaxID=418854 RepID=A0A1H0N4G4_9HYPH|nr:hypothetical protein [Filomicrobium insigne]SDO87406.1 hypothetical protein SAMN04488061_1881 [Filomicrobium insigne]